MKIRLKTNSVIKGRFYKEGDIVEITDKDTINHIKYLKRSDNIDFEIEKPLGSKSYDIFGKSLNYRFDDNDERDFILRSYVPIRENLPNIVDYTSEMSPVKDQKNLGSCTGFAIAAVKEWQERKEYLREIKEGSYYRRENDQYDLSEQWLYYKAKEIDPWPNEEGTSLRYVLKILQKQGVPPEEGWVYNDREKGEAKPWAKLIARWNFGGKYYRITSIPELKYALYDKGPVVIGIVCFEEIFNPGPSGIVPYPRNPWMYYGGHAVAVVGYDDRRKLFKFKNSWSPRWGQNGYGYLPYKYIQDFMMDAWVMEDISVKFEYVKTGINPVAEPTQTVLVEQENSNETGETTIWKKIKEKLYR